MQNYFDSMSYNIYEELYKSVCLLLGGFEEYRVAAYMFLDCKERVSVHVTPPDCWLLNHSLLSNNNRSNRQKKVKARCKKKVDKDLGI